MVGDFRVSGVYKLFYHAMTAEPGSAERPQQFRAAPFARCRRECIRANAFFQFPETAEHGDGSRRQRKMQGQPLQPAATQ